MIVLGEERSPTRLDSFIITEHFFATVSAKSTSTYRILKNFPAFYRKIKQNSFQKLQPTWNRKNLVSKPAPSEMICFSESGHHSKNRSSMPSIAECLRKYPKWSVPKRQTTLERKPRFMMGDLRTGLPTKKPMNSSA